MVFLPSYLLTLKLAQWTGKIDKAYVHEHRITSTVDLDGDVTKSLKEEQL